MSARTDEELMVEYREGDAGAFRELFARYEGMLRRIMARDLFDRAEADDLVQQTFLQLHRARFDFRADAVLRPWIITIALNLKRQYFRRRKRRPTVAIDDHEIVATGTHPISKVEAEQLRAALMELRDNQRDAIILHWFEGLSFSEIAEITGTSTSNAKVRAHRGYAVLKKRLGEDVTDRTIAAYSSVEAQ